MDYPEPRHPASAPIQNSAAFSNDEHRNILVEHRSQVSGRIRVEVVDAATG